MGSGCNPTKINGCAGKRISSDCVLYQGEPNTKLGICTGDTVTEVESALINAISNLDTTVTGDEISLNTLTITCQGVISLLGSNTKNITNVLSAIIQYTCQLQTQINNINTTIGGNGGSGTLDKKCLNPTTNNLYGIVQALIDTVCTLKTQVDNLGGDVTVVIEEGTGNFLNAAVKSCGNYGVTKSGSGQNFTMSFYGFVPPYCPIAYYGPLSNFDATGKGIDTSAYCGWYLCNGANGTPDLRGRVLVGSVNDIQGGGTLDAAVNPTNPINATGNVAYTMGTKFGENFHALSVNELPSHNHTVNDPGHSHVYPRVTADGRGGDSSKEATATSGTTDAAFTNITINNTGGNLSHENRQPSFAVAYIMRIN